jgi:hypothetical protein
MDIVASPNARLYVARCLRETGKLVEAYVEFDRTAVEADEHSREDSRYQRTGSSAKLERDAIAPKIGFLQLQIDNATPATKVLIAGEDVRRAGWSEPVPVMPGELEVVVESPPSPPVRKMVRIAPGEKQAVVLDAGSALAAAPPPNGSSPLGLRPYAYAAGAVGAAGFLTFAIAGALSNSTYSDLQSQCGSGPCPASKQSEISRGQAEQTAANVGLAIGALGIAAGATLFVLSLRTHRNAEPSPASPTMSAFLAPGWVGAGGVF